MLSRTLKGMTVAGAIAVLAVGGTVAVTAQSPAAGEKGMIVLAGGHRHGHRRGRTTAGLNAAEHHR